MELSNYEQVKEELSKNPNNSEEILKKAVNNINMDEIDNFIKKKPEPIAQSLDNIENLAFIDDDFAAKILNLGKNNKENNPNNLDANINQQNNQENQVMLKTQIALNKDIAIIPLNYENYVQVNIKNENLNKAPKHEVKKFDNNEYKKIFKEPNIKPIQISIKENISKPQIPVPIQDNKIPLNQLINQQPSNNVPINPMPINQFPINPIPINQFPMNQIPNNNIPIDPKDIPISPIIKPDIIPKKDRITLDRQDVSLGLDNVGATCYMNATLQCLAHIKRITEHILNYRKEGKLENKKKNKLSEAYSEVVQEIWKPKDKTKKSFAPKRFKQVLGEMNELFSPTAANDAKDLLIYFVEQMHSELNNTTEKNLNLIMPDDMNPMNQKQVLECFVKEFTKKYNSVFSHYCYGSNVSSTFCYGCKTSKYSYQCFSFLIFPLLEAKKNCIITRGLNQFNYNSYILNIEDCFNYNQKIEVFNGSNQMYCNVCQASKDSQMQTRISTAPLVLILILNRGKGNLDFREPFIFWESINLTNYLEFREADNMYYLSGVVSHMGDSGPSGHFIAYCRMAENMKWYCYNDSLVNESSFQEINSRGTPYILFYQKSKM